MKVILRLLYYESQAVYVPLTGIGQEVDQISKAKALALFSV
jgi:hypothetical protein